VTDFNKTIKTNMNTTNLWNLWPTTKNSTNTAQN